MAGRALKIDPKTTIASEPGSPVNPAAVEIVTESQIAARAYELWQERGRPIGSDQEDWLQAERELKSRNKSPSGRS
jgi:Protein of unknown function (DUF2934)